MVKLTMSNKKKTEQTALQWFIEKYSKEYQPPVGRAGIKKGEKIGFSQAKYDASLYSGLTNKSLKDIAKDLNISYGVLKLWRIEKDFKELMDRHVRHFSMLCFRKAFEHPDSKGDIEFELDKLTLKEIAERPIEFSKINIDQFSDADIYHPIVVNAIIERQFPHFEGIGHISQKTHVLQIKFVRQVFPHVINDKQWKRINLGLISTIKQEMVAGNNKYAMYLLRLLEEIE